MRGEGVGAFPYFSQPPICCTRCRQAVQAVRWPTSASRDRAQVAGTDPVGVLAVIPNTKTAQMGNVPETGQGGNGGIDPRLKPHPGRKGCQSWFGVIQDKNPTASALRGRRSFYAHSCFQFANNCNQMISGDTPCFKTWRRKRKGVLLWRYILWGSTSFSVIWLVCYGGSRRCLREALRRYHEAEWLRTAGG